MEDIIPIAEKMDEIGFHSLEVWGGATFDVAIRYLNEDPWLRLTEIKKRVRNTPLQMLLRGQNLVGYRNYADDVVEKFVEEAAKAGIDIFRVLDALNDERNFEASFKAIKKSGKHIQGTISYSLTEQRLGGEIFNLNYYLEKAKAIEEMGADSLCIKDMAGLLNPYDAYELISALKETINIPLQLHCHYTSGMASMTYLKAVEAGVDVIDCALAPFALRTSQPSAESMVAALRGAERDPALDIQKLFQVGSYVEKVVPKYRNYLNTTRMSVIDTGVIEHQIPGGMITNLVSQLKQAEALDRIDDVYRELPLTRKDLGYPPLVTPTSQIIGIQAVQNVLFGRYKMITEQVKDYAYGLYGSPPLPMNEKVRKKALKGYKRGEKPITCRAADMIEPELDKAAELSKGIARNMQDILICALYPTVGLRFLRWKYGLEDPPKDVRPKTMEEIKEEDELVERVKSGNYNIGISPERGLKREDARSFNVFVGNEHFSVEVEEVGGKVKYKVAGDTEPIIRKDNIKKDNIRSGKNSEVASKKDKPVSKGGEFILTAPMPGMILEYNVEEGDKVNVGDLLLILEAMKMRNSITSNVSGVVKSIRVPPGTSVEKNQALLIIVQ